MLWKCGIELIIILRRNDDRSLLRGSNQYNTLSKQKNCLSLTMLTSIAQGLPLSPCPKIHFGMAIAEQSLSIRETWTAGDVFVPKHSIEYLEFPLGISSENRS